MIVLLLFLRLRFLQQLFVIVIYVIIKQFVIIVTALSKLLSEHQRFLHLYQGMKQFIRAVVSVFSFIVCELPVYSTNPIVLAVEFELLLNRFVSCKSKVVAKVFAFKIEFICSSSFTALSISSAIALTSSSTVYQSRNIRGAAKSCKIWKRNCSSSAA